MFWGPWEGDYAHINHLKRSLLFILMTVDMKNIIYSNNNITSNRNELVRRLLSGITMSELQNLVNIREEARPIPAPRRRGGGGGKDALFLLQEEGLQFLHQGEMYDN